VRDVILLDGTCIFCSRLAAFIFRRDREQRFGFANLQGAFAKEVLARHGVMLDIDAIYLIADANTAQEQVLIDGQAGRAIWPRLIGVAVVLRFVPLPLLNLGYRMFARVRYRLFGQYDQCRAPSAEERARFLD